MDSLAVCHDISPTNDLLIDTSGHIQKQQESSAKLCLDTSQHRIPSQGAIEALGYVISVQDLGLPATAGDKVPILRISIVVVSRDFWVRYIVAFPADDETMGSLNILPLEAPEQLPCPKPTCRSSVSKCTIFAVGR
jgi:hypothetical protein